MKRVALALIILIASLAAALAQNITVIGPITPGDCTMFSSTTVLKDSGIPCPGSGGTLNLPNGTTATTQSLNDNTTKVATDQFVQSQIAAIPAPAISSLSLASGQIVVGQVSGFAGAVAMSGDCTIIASGAITCPKSGGVAFSSAAFVNVPISLANGGLGGSQAAATAGQVPVFPGGGGAAVPTTPSAVTASNIAPAIICNPEVLFDQINEGAAYPSINNQEHYGPDCMRFQGSFGAGGLGAFNIARVTTAPAGSKNSLDVTVTTQDTAPQPADNFHVEIAIEAISNRLLQFGTANAQQITYQWQQACTSNGSYSVGFMNGINSRYYVTTVNYSSAAAFQLMSITIPGDTSGTWSNNVADFGLKIIHDFGTGSNFSTTASSVWANGAFWRVTGSFSMIQQIAGTQCFLTNFQIDFGPTPLPFRYIPYESQLQFVERYVVKSLPQGTALANGAGEVGSLTYILKTSGVATGDGVQAKFPVAMVSVPAITFYGSGVASTKWTNGASTVSGTPTAFFIGTTGFFAQNPQVAGDTNLSALMSVNFMACAALGGC